MCSQLLFCANANGIAAAVGAAASLHGLALHTLVPSLSSSMCMDGICQVYMLLDCLKAELQCADDQVNSTDVAAHGLHVPPLLFVLLLPAAASAVGTAPCCPCRHAFASLCIYITPCFIAHPMRVQHGFAGPQLLLCELCICSGRMPLAIISSCKLNASHVKHATCAQRHVCIKCTAMNTKFQMLNASYFARVQSCPCTVLSLQVCRQQMSYAIKVHTHIWAPLFYYCLSFLLRSS